MRAHAGSYSALYRCTLFHISIYMAVMAFPEKKLFYTSYFLHRKLFSDPDLAFRGCFEGPTPWFTFVQVCTTRRPTLARLFSRARLLQTPQEPSSSRRHF